MANIGITEVTAASLEAISRLLNLNIQRATIMRDKVLDLSSEAVAGTKTLKIRKFTDLSVQTKVENTDLTFGISTLSTDDLALDQHKAVAFLVEEFAKLQGPTSFFMELATNAGIKIAQDYDQALIDMIEAGATTATVIIDTGTKIPVQADIVELRRQFDAADVDQRDRFLGIHPNQYAHLLNISTFIEADKMGVSNIQSGVVGELFGMRVISNTGFADNKLLAWQREAGVGAIQLTPSIRQVYDVDALADKWAIHTVYGTKIIAPLKALLAS